MICSSWQVGGDALTDSTCTVTGLAAGYSYYARVTATATHADGSSLPACSSADSEVVTTLTAAEDALLEKEAALALARSVAEEKARLEQEALQALQRAEESERQLAALQTSTAAQVAATRAEVDQARASLVCAHDATLWMNDCVCVRACVRACVCACVCVCVCVCVVQSLASADCMTQWFGGLVVL